MKYTIVIRRKREKINHSVSAKTPEKAVERLMAAYPDGKFKILTMSEMMSDAVKIPAWRARAMKEGIAA